VCLSRGKGASGLSGGIPSGAGTRDRESDRRTGSWDNVGRDSSGRWTVGGTPLDNTRAYRVVTTDFLVSGAERNLGYLAPGHPDLRMLRELRDIRQVVMTELRRRYGLP